MNRTIAGLAAAALLAAPMAVSAQTYREGDAAPARPATPAGAPHVDSRAQGGSGGAYGARGDMRGAPGVRAGQDRGAYAGGYGRGQAQGARGYDGRGYDGRSNDGRGRVRSYDGYAGVVGLAAGAALVGGGYSLSAPYYYDDHGAVVYMEDDGSAPAYGYDDGGAASYAPGYGYDNGQTAGYAYQGGSQAYGQDGAAPAYANGARGSSCSRWIWSPDIGHYVWGYAC